MRAHYLQHVPFEGLGCIEPWLTEHGYQITATRFFESAELPPVADMDLVVVLGGPMSVNDTDVYPWLNVETQFIRDCIDAGVPVLGICLGAQLIARAMGAAVRPNAQKEIGWFPVYAPRPAAGAGADAANAAAAPAAPEAAAAAGAAADANAAVMPEVAGAEADSAATVFRFPDALPVFHWHGETFDLPAGAVLLAESPACRNQTFQLGRTVLALQFHLETTPEAARQLVQHCGHELAVAGRATAQATPVYVQTAAAILAAEDELYRQANRVMAQLLTFLCAAPRSHRLLPPSQEPSPQPQPGTQPGTRPPQPQPLRGVPNDRFYANLPELQTFDQVFDGTAFRQFPPDWFVVVTDVVDSTAAIAAGRYKEVNIAGALATMALANELADFDFPFVFGGDGTTFVLPATLAARVRPLLADTRQTVATLFELQLRVGIVPLRDLYDQGFTLGVARLRVSDRYTQAVLDGSGVDAAERWVKDPVVGARYRLPADGDAAIMASFAGFTCRWQDVPSIHGETVALIAKPVAGATGSATSAMNAVLALIRATLGPQRDYNPLAAGPHALAPPRQTRAEAQVMARAKRGLLVALAHIAIRVQVRMMAVVVRLGLPIRVMGKTLSEVPKDNVRSSDYRKYDGNLKMVIACSPNERAALQKGLDELAQQGSIRYGLHVSDRAMITCLIHPNSPREVHFVDAADGGYALAAAQLKARDRLLQ